MTGSFSCMSLMSLLVFDTAGDSSKKEYVDTIARLGESVIKREDTIAQLLDVDFNRIAYLGSGTWWLDPRGRAENSGADGWAGCNNL